MRAAFIAAALSLLAVHGISAATVARYEPLDIEITSTRQFGNPWRDVRISAILTSPRGRKIELSGFYDGAGRWIVRTAMDELGPWRLTTRSTPEYLEFSTQHQIEVTPGGGSGPLRIDPERLRLVHADGKPFFVAGDTCYPLLGLDRDSQRIPYLTYRKQQGFTLIRWQAAMVEPRFPGLWPWGGTPSKPELDTFNPDYFRRMDSLMRDLREQGLQTEIILLNFYPTGAVMKDPRLWTADREKAWIAYLTARYAAFDNVAWWTLANEFETRPDGIYRLDEPADVDWVRSTAAYVKSIDPWTHPVTVHPYSGYEKYLQAFGSSPEIDILSLQEHGAETKVSRYLSEGDGSGLEKKALSARATGKMVVDSEFGYEWDGSTMRGSNVSSDLQRRQAWRIVMGGGHFSAGFRSTVFNFPEISFDWTNGRRPGGQYISILARFFREQTQFWKLRPAPDLVEATGLCLRGDGEYVAYVPEGGEIAIDLKGTTEPLIVRWLNPLSGEVKDGGEIQGGDRRSIEAPWAEAVLHLSTAVTVVAPEDSGWPRNPDKITRRGPSHFFVDADGHERYVLAHAVNRSRTPKQITLEGFLNQFGRMRNKQYSEAQYLYVQLPNAPWQRVYRTAGRLSLTLPPGVTAISTVVPFAHREYLDYVGSLNDPRVRKEVVLSSGRGSYPVYRIRITNPGGKNKLRIAVARTNHAYERSGFYMTQGLISWLLSGDPAANLDHVEWTVYPCLDPQAVHDGQDYTEYDKLILDDGRSQRDALWNPRTGELPSAHYHVLTDLHMWELRDRESYKYNDPFAPSGTKGNGRSEVEQVMLAFWPFWYEFGIDDYDHENKWQSENALPANFGGALVTHLEIPFYGKDDIDPRDRLREQGRLLARSHSQAFLRMQRDHNFWTESSQGGAVNVNGAVILTTPEPILLETMTPRAGRPAVRANSSGGPLSLYKEVYEHGLGMRAGDRAEYDVPVKATTFRAMVGIDDAEASSSTVTFVVEADGKEIWRSRPVKRADRQLAFVDIRKARRLTIRVDGPRGLLGNWGGAKITCNDPEAPFAGIIGLR